MEIRFLQILGQLLNHNSACVALYLVSYSEILTDFHGLCQCFTSLEANWKTKDG